MGYFKKSHQHKPKKGKGSYDKLLEKLKTPIPDEPSGLLCGYRVKQDDLPLTEKYRGEGHYADKRKG